MSDKKRLEIKDGDRTVGWVEAADISPSPSSLQKPSNGDEPHSDDTTTRNPDKVRVIDDSPEPKPPPTPPDESTQDPDPPKPFLRTFLGI